MVNLNSFLHGLKRVTDDCYSIFEPYYEARARVYVYPVFFQSVTQMLSSGGYFYKIFQHPNGRTTLAIFKRSNIMGNYSCMLNIAPISLTGRVADEIEIIQAARHIGISVKLCSEDIRRYKIPSYLTEPIQGNMEYVYDANECFAMQGGKFHGFRRQVRRVTNMPGYRHTFGANDDIARILDIWDRHNHLTRQKQHQGSQSHRWNRVKAINDGHVVIHSVFIGDRLEGFSVIERLSRKTWALVMGVRNYESDLNDVNRCMHWLDCEIAHNDNARSVYANLGAAIGITGLDAEKEKLKPCAHLQIFKLKPSAQTDVAQLKQIFKTI